MLPHSASHVDGAPARAVAESRQEGRRLVATYRRLDRHLAVEAFAHRQGQADLRFACRDNPRRPVEIDRVGKSVIVAANRPSQSREHRAELSIGQAHKGRAGSVSVRVETDFDDGVQRPE